MSEVLLRNWAEARLEAEDLDHRRRYVLVDRLNERGRLYRAHRLSQESAAVGGRIDRVTAKLRQQCTAGEVTLGGCPLGPDYLGPKQQICVPASELNHVRFFLHVSRLKYRHLEFVGVEVRDSAPNTPKLSTSRGRGRPSEWDKIIATFDALVARGTIREGMSWRTKAKLIRDELGIPEDKKGFGHETVRRAIEGRPKTQY